ncbi:MAG: chemotaxis protein CheW [Paracoccus sp. (in: a-proteobacteria)]|uniref:chemotaxis protein CheW n=1 Tax=Paracoccus sp. TaxID=267 RepID=UPI00391D2FE3
MNARAQAMNALTIRLDDELFAIEASQVREILELVTITDMPDAPPFVGGLINVRGRVVPLADLRVIFGMRRPEPDEDTRIVVMELDLGGEPTVVGILADKVHDVTDIEADCIEEAPKVGMRWKPELVRAIGKRDGGFIIIPDMERIFETPGAGKSPLAASEERFAS